MIIFILTIVVALIGVLLIILSQKFDWGDDGFIGAIPAATGVVGFFVCGIMALCINGHTTYRREMIKYETKVEELTTTYNVLIEHNDASYARYTAIQQYNQEVREFKQNILDEQWRLKNPWINWYHCSAYAKMDYNIVSYIEVK